MGLDWLEFSLHLEKEHGITVHFGGAAEALDRAKTELPKNFCRGTDYDWRVAAFFACIREHCYRLCPSCSKASAKFSGHPVCSKCGQALVRTELLREQCDEAMRAVTGEKVITDEMWLTRDLAFY